MKMLLRLLLVLGAFMVFLVPADDAQAATFNCPTANSTDLSQQFSPTFSISSSQCLSNSGGTFSVTYDDSTPAFRVAGGVSISSMTIEDSAGGICYGVNGGSFRLAFSPFPFTCRFKLNLSNGYTVVSSILYSTVGGWAQTVDAAVTTPGPAPTVTSISPTFGPGSGGTSVTIAGTNFTGATAVRFGATAATGFTVNSATQITATAPAGSGTVDITVTTAVSTSATSAADQFTYVAQPAVTSISPSSGPTSGGTSVTITGTNFTGATAVQFGATAATGFTVNSATQVTATAPAGTGTVDITVTTAGSTSATGAGDRFTYVAQPAVTSISPSSGATAGGATVTITGTNFTGATVVRFGATAATGFTVNSATQVTATAPAGTGTVDITVTAAGGTSVTSAADQFTYVSAPAISSVSPADGPVYGGATVTINGTNLSGATVVNFGANTATPIANTPTQVVVVTPQGIAAGAVNVSVTTAGGTATASNAYSYHDAPTINALSPFTGPAAGGTVVTIVGANFTGVTGVSFGGTAASYTVNNNSQITAIAPAGSGLVDVAVFTAGGSATAVGAFAYIGTPTINSVSPSAGPTSGGVAVIITGTAFTGATGVAFGSTPASFTVDSSTQITATSPAGTGTVDVAVTTVGGTSGTSAADQYSYLSAPTVSAAFANSPVLVGNTVALNITLSNPNSVPITGVSLSGILPSGLTFISATVIGCSASLASTPNSFNLGNGIIAGNANCTLRVIVNPQIASNFVFTSGSVTASGPGSLTGGTASALLTAIAPVVLSPGAGALPDATAGAAYSQTFVAGQGTAPYSAAITAGTLPAGLSFNTATLTLSGTPTTAGTFSFTVQVQDSGSSVANNSYTLTVRAPTITIAPASMPTATVGAGYSTTIVASGGTAPYSYAVTAGAFPAGLSLNNSTGIISGVPTAGGAYNFTITATDSTGGAGAPYAGSRAYTLSVAAPSLVLTPGTLATPVVGVPYSQAFTVSGGIETYSFAVTSGVLPAGLSLGSNGVLSGTPTTAGPFQFSITATDSSGGTGPFTVTRTYTINIGVPTITVAPTTLPSGKMAAAYSQTLTASGGIGPYSYAVTSGGLPEGLTLSPSGVISGTPLSMGVAYFTVTASDNGNYSGDQIYSLVIIAPDAPVAAAVSNVVVAYGSTGHPIDLSSAISGVHSSVAVATAPAHGTTSVSGDVVTYVPAAGYYGADSFTYNATGLGGTSNTATVTVIVATPAAPVATDKTGVAVTYNSAGTAIDLSGSIVGVHSTIATAVGPAHGTVSISGDVVTYTPAAGYYGADSFTYTATGPGGTSAPATVTLTVAIPAAPVAANKTGVAVAYNSTGTAIDLTSSVTGVYSSIAIATGPAHGTTSVAGIVVTYTPAAGYYGADSFTYTATGPGGTSAPATVTVTVATPAAPVATSPNTLIVPYGSSGTTIDLSASVTGVYSSVGIASGASHGTATLSGRTVTYVPAAGFSGVDQFSYTATGPGGTSMPATVSITVQAPLLTAAAHQVTATDGETLQVDMLAGSTGGPFAGAAILSVLPAQSADVRVVEGGTLGNRTYTARIAVASRFSGTITIRYTLTNGLATSDPATITVQVSARPNPGADKGVRAVNDLQTESVLRFSRSQTQNFMRRMEHLHGSGGNDRPQMDVAINFADIRQPGTSAAQLERQADNAVAGRFAGNPGTAATTNAGRSAAAAGPAGASATPSPAGRQNGSIAIWTGGAIDIATRDRNSNSDRLSATSIGLSGGVDVKVSSVVTIGLGGGFATEHGEGDKGTATSSPSVHSSSSFAAAYGSFAPAPEIFVDAMVAVGDLGFETRRSIDGVAGQALGSRDGKISMGSIAVGLERGSRLRWSAYGRTEWVDATFAAYRETGGGKYDLRFDERSLKTLGGVVGGRASFAFVADTAIIQPRLKAEWRHEFRGQSVQMLDYADRDGAAGYRLDGLTYARDQLETSLGASIAPAGDWTFDLELALRMASSQQSAALRIEVSRGF
ncbi:MAG: hypothetical protein RLZZ08_294 [Pseudomonadota bacterium]